MFLDLEVLDAFRVPREPDTPPVPPKAVHRSKTSLAPPINNLHRRSSHQPDKARGFFSRLGRDTRDVWDGLSGRTRGLSLSRQDDPDIPFASSSTEPAAASQTVPAASSRVDPSICPYNSADRYLISLDKLEKTFLSPTPGLAIPMPPLLLRIPGRQSQKPSQIIRFPWLCLFGIH